MMKLYLIWLLLSCFFLVPTPDGITQERSYFKGKVIADDNGDPLIGAHIRLKTDRSIGASTNIHGEFLITLTPGRHTFVLSYTGMATDSITLTFSAGETLERIIRMKPFVSQFEAVEIRVGKFERRFEDITVSMEVIKAGLIESKNTTNIKTILDYVPGLIILDDEPQIRGGSGYTFGVGSKVGVIIDDMPILSGDASRPYWNFIPVENIEQIEVVKGAASVLSGANALSGAIYIRTKLPKLEPVTNLKVYTGAYTTPKFRDMKWWNGYPYIAGADFLHSQTFGSSDFVFGGNLHAEHGYIGAPKPNPVVIDTLTNFSDREMAERRGRVNFNYRKRSKKTEGLNFGINGNMMLSHHNLSLAWLDDSSGFYRAYPGAVILQDQLIFNVDPYVNYYSKLGIRHSLKTRILHNNILGSNNQDNRSTVYFADYNFKRDYEFLKDFVFIGGLSTQYNDVTSSLYTGSGSMDNRLLNISGYGEFENSIFSLIKFSFGARVEYFSLNDSTSELKPIFRAGASLKLMPETFIRFSYGQGYRYPTIAERYILNNMGSFAVFPNPGLKPESSVNTEVGVKQGFKFMNFFGYLDVSLFKQEYKNTIEYLFGFWDPAYISTPVGFRFLNTGRSQITGLDVSMTGVGKMGRHGEIKVLFGYNYIMPKTLEPDLIFAQDYNPVNPVEFSFNSTSVNPGKQILKYRFLHNLKADTELNYKNWSAGASLKYFSKIENLDKAILDFEEHTLATGGTLQAILYSDYFMNHNNGNLVMDFRLGYQWNIHRISLVSDNALNHWYSLRPLKAEPMRKIILQYAVKL
jgi:outer membrane receptor protein involved in Fe transport